MKSFEVFMEFKNLILKTNVKADSLEEAIDDIQELSPWYFLNGISAWESGGPGEVVGIMEREAPKKEEVSETTSCSDEETEN